MEILSSKQLVSLAKQTIQEVEVHEAKKMIDCGNILLIDVREPGEYIEGHVAGATNIPRGVLEFKLDPENSKDFESLQNTDLPMIVYCRSGARSALAVQSIHKLGYRRAISMAGGMEKWKAENLPWVK